jgi:hypothetical protein
MEESSIADTLGINNRLCINFSLPNFLYPTFKLIIKQPGCFKTEGPRANLLGNVCPHNQRIVVRHISRNLPKITKGKFIFSKAGN